MVSESSRRVLKAVATMMVAAIAAVGVAGCGNSHSAGGSSGPSSAPTSTAPPPTTAPPTTVATVARTTVPSTTTTTVAAIPSAPQASPGAASAALVQYWEKADRTGAATVATAKAVAAMFAKPYTTQTVISRGCSTAFQIVCTWGPYGGSPSTDPLYEIYVKQIRSNWYVSEVVVE